MYSAGVPHGRFTLLRVDRTDGVSVTAPSQAPHTRRPLLGAQVLGDGDLDRRSWLESLEAVWELLCASRACRPDQTIVVATSAIRSASNGMDLVREIELRHGLRVRVLTPEDEA